MARLSPINSTNVRFVALAAMLAAGLAACATGPANVRNPSRACATPALLVCEQFGPERVCTCEQSADISVLRDALTGAAWRDGFTR